MESIIKVNNLSISYSKRSIIEDLSLEIPRNQVTAIVGPSGCGKSTLLKSLNFLLGEEHDVQVKGQISFDGKVIDYEETIEELRYIRKDIGMLFQNPTPFPFSVQKNLDIVYDEWIEEYSLKDENSKQRYFTELLDSVCLQDEVENCLKKNALELSGGQQQRLCLIRALLTKPKVLLLDEPCSSLDPISTQKIEELIKKLKKEISIVIVTHDLHQAKRVADNLLVMWPVDGEGKIVESGKCEELFSNPKSHITESYLKGELPRV